eukprot:2712901-Pyramimonas_sp.AAC.1
MLVDPLRVAHNMLSSHYELASRWLRKVVKQNYSKQSIAHPHASARGGAGPPGRTARALLL